MESHSSLQVQPSEDTSQTSQTNGNTIKRKNSVQKMLDTNKCKPVDEDTVFNGSKLQLNQYKFEDGKGNELVTEGIHKRRQNGSKGIDDSNDNNISTIAVLRRHILCDCLMLAKQYRPPLKAYTLEFPGTFIESSGIITNADEIAKQEIADDIGYTSTKVKHVSPDTATDPDLSDGTQKLVSLYIDGDDPINNNNKISGGKTGDVEIVQVPINGLLDRLDEYSRVGIVIDSRVYAFAIGLKKGEKLVQAQSQPEAETPI